MIDNDKNIEIKFGNGDKIRLKDFFYLYYPQLTVFANKYILDVTVCEDIAQEVFIKFWEKRKSFQNIVAAKSYLYTSLRNSCLDVIKHQKVEKKYIDYSIKREEPSDFFLDEVLKTEAYNEIYQEVNKLPEMGRKILILALKEKSNEEISGILNIAISTVKTHKSRAYKVLRSRLKDVFVLFVAFKKTQLFQSN